MRVVRPIDLVVPSLVGGAGALLLGAAAGKGLGSAGAGLAVGAAVWVLALAAALRKPLRRLRLARRPFPTAWRDWMLRTVRFYRVLDAPGQARFERDVAWILDALRFEGAGGVEPTDELRLAVAAGAAMMLAGHPDWELPAARTILFVPGAFDEAYGDEEEGVYDGMVHAQGPVVLSAEAVRDGWRREDGLNVVLHELAHLFDFDGWDADGVPVFMDPRSAASWQALMRDEMRKAERGKSVLRGYAASAPAELFAVATEQFFERPARLRRRHPELFAALEAFYNATPPDEPEPEGAPRSAMARRWGGEA
jgi:Mlc titration factor MtfA (ptsG expression regulator)